MGKFSKYINFDEMITPVIIKIIFWIGVIACVIFGLITTFSGIAVMFSPFGGFEGFMMFIGGLLTIVLGVLGVRVYCELLIIFFKMPENLASLNRKVDELKENQE